MQPSQSEKSRPQDRELDPITTFRASWTGTTSLGRIVAANAIVILLTILIRMPLLSIPLERDEGEYAYIGWRLGYHELPYRDWIDQKPPAIFWVYKAALSLPLSPVRSIHLAALLFSALTACALFFLARRFMSWSWAIVAASLFALLSADPLIQGTAANTEVFMLLPLILSLLAFLRAASKDRNRALFALLSGLSTGLAAAFKQVAAVNWLLPIALLPFFAPAGKRLRSTLSYAGWSTAGFAAVWGGILTYFGVRHGLGDLIYNVFTHNLEYIHSLSWSIRSALLASTVKALSQTEAPVWIFSAIGFVALWRKRSLKSFLFLAGWLITSMIAVSASGYYFPHYFQQILPALTLAAAIGAESISGVRLWARVPAWCRLAVLVTILAIPPALTSYPFLFEYTPAEAVRKIYPGNSFAVMPDLAKRVAEVTRPEDRVFIFGAEPEMLFYARRASATRYIFLFPLYGSYRDAREKQTATAQEVIRSQPAAALFMPNQLFFLPDTEQFFTRWTQSYLRENFRIDTYLTVDRLGALHLIPANAVQQAIELGQQAFAEFLVRSQN